MASPLSCEQCEALLPGYVLTALEPHEAATVAEHLSTCAQCQAHLETYEAILVRLVEALPVHTPPAALRQRLFAVMQTEHVSTASQDLSPGRATGLRRMPRWALGLMAASVLLFLGMAWVAWTLWQQTTVTQAAWSELQERLRGQQQILALLADPQTRHVFLRGDVAGARGILLLQPAASTAALVAQDFPTLKPDRVYQLWLLRDSQRDDGGTFRVDEHGYGILLITAPRPLAAYRAAGITEEPAGGSPGPTTSRVAGSPL